MSNDKEFTLWIGAATVISSVIASVVGTIWIAAQLHKQVETNTENIKVMQQSIVELTKIIVKDRK